MTISLRGAGLLLALGLIILDQSSKLLSDALLAYGQPQSVFPGFDLMLVYNSGAAFSFLSGAGGWQRWLLAGISLLVTLALLAWLRRLSPDQKLQGIALGFVLGGAVGNLIDRFYLGYVIDFISLYAGDWRFATFNIADAAISIGAVLLVLDVFMEGRRNE